MSISSLKPGAAAAFLGAALWISPASSEALAQESYDLLITNTRVLDGTGNPWFHADVAVRDGRIAAVGRLHDASAGRILDASGLVLAPGFIDIHSHAAGGLVDEDPFVRSAPNLVAQGITTVVINQDGRSPWPIADQISELRSLDQGVNTIVLMGHGQLRQEVMPEGDVERLMTPTEIERLRELARQGMEEGAWGISAGVEYHPGRYSDTDEIVAAVEEIVPWDGIYVSHQRGEGSDPMWYWPSRDEPGPPDLIDSVLETIEIGERTGATVVATHVKAKGEHYWGTSSTVIQLIEAARERGVRVYADQYGYETTGSDGNTRLIPAWAVEEGTRLAGGEESDELTPAEAVEHVLASGELARDLRSDIAHEIRRRGGPDRIVVIEHVDPSLEGMTVRDLAARWDVDPVEVAIRIQLDGDREERGGARIRGFSLHDMDIRAYHQRDWVMTATDGGIAVPGEGLPHARLYGTFPRLVGHYARDEGVVTLADALRSGTSLPAQVLGIRDRGMIREGFHADLVLFDPDAVEDRTSFFDPHQYPAGIPYVLVNGEFVVDEGDLTGARPGRVVTPETGRRPPAR